MFFVQGGEEMKQGLLEEEMEAVKMMQVRSVQ